MPLYMCSKCGCVENTATGGYWTQQAKWVRAGKPGKFEPLCSEHDPAIGKWHGRFPQMKAEGFLQSKDGYIYSPEEAANYFKGRGPFRPVKLPEGK